MPEVGSFREGYRTSGRAAIHAGSAGGDPIFDTRRGVGCRIFSFQLGVVFDKARVGVQGAGNSPFPGGGGICSAWAPDATPEETCSGFRLLIEPHAENRRLHAKAVIMRWRLEDLERRHHPGSRLSGPGGLSFVCWFFLGFVFPSRGGPFFLPRGEAPFVFCKACMHVYPK